MNYLKKICKNHLSDKFANDLWSLNRCNAVLQQPKINKDVSDFWAIIGLIDIYLDSYIIIFISMYCKYKSINKISGKLINSTNTKRYPRSDTNLNWHSRLNEICRKLLEFNLVSIIRKKLMIIDEGNTDTRDIIFENTILFIWHVA